MSVVAEEVAKHGNLTIKALRMVKLELPKCESMNELIEINVSSKLKYGIFETTNEYLNRLIEDKVIKYRKSKTTIRRTIVVEGITLHILLDTKYVDIIVNYVNYSFKYRHITEGLLKHIVEHGDWVQIAQHYSYDFHYKGVKITFECHEALKIVCLVIINDGFSAGISKYGNPIGETIAKCRSLMIAIFDNYLEPIGLANITRNHMKIVERMFDSETIVIPKSARSQ